MVLDQNTPGNITALVLFPWFYRQLNDNEQKLFLQSELKALLFKGET
jgi:hypothetical protein